MRLPGFLIFETMDEKELHEAAKKSPGLAAFAGHLGEQDYPDGAVHVEMVGEVGFAPGLDIYAPAT